MDFVPHDNYLAPSMNENSNDPDIVRIVITMGLFPNVIPELSEVKSKKWQKFAFKTEIKNAKKDFHGIWRVFSKAVKVC